MHQLINVLLLLLLFFSRFSGVLSKSFAGFIRRASFFSFYMRIVSIQLQYFNIILREHRQSIVNENKYIIDQDPVCLWTLVTSI